MRNKHRIIREWGELDDTSLLVTTDKDYQSCSIEKDGMMLTFYSARKVTSGGVYDPMYIVIEACNGVNVTNVMELLDACKLKEYNIIKPYHCISVIKDESSSKRRLVNSIISKSKELGFIQRG